MARRRSRRFIVAAQVVEQQREIITGSRVVRIEADCGAIGNDRLVRLLQIPLDLAEVVPGLGVAGVAADGGAIAVGCLLIPPAGQQHVAKVMVGFRQCRLKNDRSAETRFRLPAAGHIP